MCFTLCPYRSSVCMLFVAVYSRETHMCTPTHTHSHVCTHIHTCDMYVIHITQCHKCTGHLTNTAFTLASQHGTVWHGTLNMPCERVPCRAEPYCTGLDRTTVWHSTAQLSTAQLIVYERYLSRGLAYVHVCACAKYL